MERAGFAFERFHQLDQLLKRRVGEAGADFARVHELAIVVITDQQRSWQAAALALALEPAADDELLAHSLLHLHPQAAAAARSARRAHLFAHDSFAACLP